MPRKNLLILLIAAGLFLLCYTQVSRLARARQLGAILEVIRNKGLHSADERDLFNVAASAMAESHDPHSSYIPPPHTDRYIGMLDQQLTGIGISVRRDPETDELIVQSPIIGKPYPAYDAGMRSGDRIIRVAGEAVAGQSLQEVTQRIRGKEGTAVEIVVRPEGTEELKTLEVTRSEILVDSVVGAFRNLDLSWTFLHPTSPNIAYLQVTDFGKHTVDELHAAITELQAMDHLDGMIIDLRDNSGGYLDIAVDASDLFLDSGTIVTTRGRKNVIRETYEASRRAALRDVPMAILINGETASASEIFAACMQDHGRAKVIGSRSFGKGSVQQMIPLPDGGLLKLTTATYHRPSGVNIHREPQMGEEATWGVSPDTDLEVPLSEEQESQWRLRRSEQIATPKRAKEAANVPLADPALEKAIEILNAEESKPASDPQTGSHKHHALNSASFT